jgi:CheY-like chemotaxis protein
MPDSEEMDRARTLTSAFAPVVLMVPMGQCRDQMLHTAAVASLIKPIKYAQLYKCLDDVLTRRVDAPAMAPRAPLPLRAPVPAPAQAATPPALEPPQESRILVVDDNIVTQQIALHQLHKMGYRAEAVSSSLAMYEALRQHSYALVLLDSHMPQLEGYAAATALCHQAGAAHYIPMIAMTTTTNTDERAQCLAAGMDDTISKPVKTDAMQAVLGRWLAN